MVEDIGYFTFSAVSQLQQNFFGKKIYSSVSFRVNDQS